jgi:hypothetical protein
MRLGRLGLLAALAVGAALTILPVGCGDSRKKSDEETTKRLPGRAPQRTPTPAPEAGKSPTPLPGKQPAAAGSPTPRPFLPRGTPRPLISPTPAPAAEATPEEAQAATDALPKDFPIDVPLYAGAKRILSFKDEDSDSFVVNLESEEDVPTVVRNLQRDLRREGWERVRETRAGDSATLRYEKGNRVATVKINGQGDATEISLFILTEEE